MTVVKSAFEETENHLYETDYWATLAALKHVSLFGMNVWECAAGNHKMADILRTCSGAASVTTSDIKDYNRRHDFIADFLNPDIFAVQIAQQRWQAIFTNPPFGAGNHTAAKFCRMALRRCHGVVVMLCTAKFDFGSSRYDLFRDNERFQMKICLTDRIRWFDMGDDAKDGTEDHAFYVWRPRNTPYAPPRIVYEGNPFK